MCFIWRMFYFIHFLYCRRQCLYKYRLVYLQCELDSFVQCAFCCCCWCKIWKASTFHFRPFWWWAKQMLAMIHCSDITQCPQCCSVSLFQYLFRFLRCAVPWMLVCAMTIALISIFHVFYAYNKRQMIVLVWWWLLLLRSSWYKAFALNEREIHISNSNQNEMHFKLFYSNLKQARKQQNEKKKWCFWMCDARFEIFVRLKIFIGFIRGHIFFY